MPSPAARRPPLAGLFPRTPELTHAGLVRECSALLAERGVPHGIVPQYSRPRKGRRYDRESTGMPDLVACLPGGRFLGVECKVGRDVVRPEQLQFQMHVNGCGGLLVVVRAALELRALLDREAA